MRSSEVMRNAQYRNPPRPGIDMGQLMDRTRLRMAPPPNFLVHAVRRSAPAWLWMDTASMRAAENGRPQQTRALGAFGRLDPAQMTGVKKASGPLQKLMQALSRLQKSR
ncbi:hypothetical protein EAH83_19945 [Variovorax ginsengisoli]|uniref:Uncharacterized protein n=1 Tax=Variovorax guangxiensis TaxID=1775474 RepID=A0A502DHN1_9BURK|nr:hypothetical protein EAH83_19945 [Variovorax ginsengisoli]TPG23606.1 hypothetical protein EAH82_19610 [Variovorax guangxiensis]